MFDHIIMNPPYNGTLHLRILEKVLEYKKDNGICACLHPVFFLEQPQRAYKKTAQFDLFDKGKLKQLIDNKLTGFEVIDGKFFDAAFSYDIGITSYDGNKKVIDNTTLITNDSPELLKKVILPIYNKQAKSLFQALSKETNGDFTITVPEVHGHRSTKTAANCFSITVPEVHGNRGSKDMYDVTSKDYEVAKHAQSRIVDKYGSLHFKTEEERKNWFDSVHTGFYRYVHHLVKTGQFVESRLLPWMEDYTQPWTNERFFDYYDVSKETRAKIIEWAKDYE